MNTVATQEQVDQLRINYQRKKREVDRGLAEMRAIRKEIDLLEDLMIIEVMKGREISKKELLHG